MIAAMTATATKRHEAPPALARAAFDLGWDYAAFRGLPPPPETASEIKRGYLEGLRRLGNQQKPHDRFVRKWLQLRLHAIERNREFSDEITPDFLRSIDVPYCPVTFERLTHGECPDSDWSIDRLVNAGAYADGNLAVMSTRVNKAKWALDLEGVLHAIDNAQISLQGTFRGLTLVEWRRLAALMPGPHAAVTGQCLVGPQCTPLPPRVVALPHQVIQNELVYRLSGAQASERVLQPFRKLGGKASTKLFRKIEKKIEERAPRLPMSQWRKACPFDVWLDHHLFETFCEWRASLPAGAAATILGEMRKFVTQSGSEATRTWAVERRGYAA